SLSEGQAAYHAIVVALHFVFGGDADAVVSFFFQAEDGIRDGHVTGVQTCALPISATDSRPLDPGVARGPGRGLSALRAHSSCARSEERRVGKECRSRWWADQ